MEFKVGGSYTVVTERANIPLHVILCWISPDNRHAEITYGYSVGKRHKITADKLKPWPYQK